MEIIKRKLISLFPKPIVRFDRPDYIEIELKSDNVESSKIRNQFDQFLIKNKINPIFSNSPKDIESDYCAGSILICDDHNHDLIVKVVLFIKYGNF